MADFIVRNGRALVFPVLKGTFERRVKSGATGPNTSRERMIQRSKDLGRTIDYLATRPDIDARKIAYYGYSWGAFLAPIMTAVEERFKVSILLAGGLPSGHFPPEIEPANPRRSPRVDHFCSFKLTHAENRIWRIARRRPAILSTPKACGLIFHPPRQRRVTCSVSTASHVCWETINRPGRRCLARNSIWRAPKHSVASRQTLLRAAPGVGHFWRAKPGKFSRVPNPRTSRQRNHTSS